MEEIDFEPYVTDLYIEAMRWAVCKPADWVLAYQRAGSKVFLEMFGVRHIDFGVRSGKTTAAVQFAKRSKSYGIVTYSHGLAQSLAKRFSINTISMEDYVEANPHWDFTIFDDPLPPHELGHQKALRLSTALLANKPHRFICLGRINEGDF